MKRFYLAGQMTGADNFNYDAFHMWAQRLRDLYADTAEVINPAENFEGDQGLPYRTYIETAIGQVASADAVFLLPEWYNSRKGAYIELMIALGLGLHVYELAEEEDSILGWTSREIAVTGDITVRTSSLMNGFNQFVCTIGAQNEADSGDIARELKEQFDFVTGGTITKAEALRREKEDFDEAVTGKSFEQRLAEGYTNAEEFAKKNREWLVQDPTAEPPRITDEAWNLVMGDRQASYGHPASDFAAMGRISGAILSRWLESEGLAIVPKEMLEEWPDEPVHFPDIEPRIVALIMTAVKISRLSAQHKHDSTTDLIGYAICEDRIAEGY